MNFEAFYHRATLKKNKKRSKGRYKGQQNMQVPEERLYMRGPRYNPNPATSDAPSSSTYVVKG